VVVHRARPELPEPTFNSEGIVVETIPPIVWRLAELCWAQVPEERPNAVVVYDTIRHILDVDPAAGLGMSLQQGNQAHSDLNGNTPYTPMDANANSQLETPAPEEIPLQTSQVEAQYAGQVQLALEVTAPDELTEHFIPYTSFNDTEGQGKSHFSQHSELLDPPPSDPPTPMAHREPQRATEEGDDHFLGPEAMQPQYTYPPSQSQRPLPLPAGELSRPQHGGQHARNIPPSVQHAAQPPTNPYTDMQFSNHPPSYPQNSYAEDDGFEMANPVASPPPAPALSARNRSTSDVISPIPMLPRTAPPEADENSSIAPSSPGAATPRRRTLRAGMSDDLRTPSSAASEEAFVDTRNSPQPYRARYQLRDDNATRSPAVERIPLNLNAAPPRLQPGSSPTNPRGESSFTRTNSVRRVTGPRRAGTISVNPQSPTGSPQSRSDTTTRRSLPVAQQPSPPHSPSLPGGLPEYRRPRSPYDLGNFGREGIEIIPEAITITRLSEVRPLSTRRDHSHNEMDDSLCLVCRQPFPTSSMVRIEQCRHDFCRDCLRNHLRDSLTPLQRVVACPMCLALTKDGGEMTVTSCELLV
jgi:hypothetical protein